MAKARRDEHNGEVTVTIRCPGCRHGVHTVRIASKLGLSCWSYFNNDLEKPTIRESIAAKRTLGNGTTEMCHSYVTDGNIEFLNDSTHALAGKTVPLLNIETPLGDIDDE